MTLIPSEPVAAVPQSQAAGRSKRDEQEIAKQDTKVIEFIHTILTLVTQMNQLNGKGHAIRFLSL